MTSTAAIAEFAADVTYDRLPKDVREALKRRLLDSLAVGLRTTGTETSDAIRRGLRPAGSSDAGCRSWGTATTGAPQSAAMGNAASIASGHGPTFLSPTLVSAGGSIAAVLTVADAIDATGEETLAGLAVALEIHGEFAWRVPLNGFHPATHAAIAGAAGAGRTMGFDAATLADAIGTAASRVTLDVGEESFTPVATGDAAAAAVSSCLLADGGIDAPDGLADSNGWHDLFGTFDLDFDPGCERVRDAAILPYDGHPYEQPAIEVAIDLATDVPIDPADIDAVTVETFEAAASVIDPVRIAAALVDRELAVHRGRRADLDPIVEATTITATGGFDASTERESLPVRVTVSVRDGATSDAEADTFDGHPSTPASWGTVEGKFHALVGERYDRERRARLVATVRSFEAESATELVRLLD